MNPQAIKQALKLQQEHERYQDTKWGLITLGILALLLVVFYYLGR